MQRVRDQSAKAPGAEDAAGLAKTIRELSATLETLGPAEAAAAWIAAYDEWQIAPHGTLPGGRVLNFSDLVNALPAPEAWPELVRLIDSRPVDGSGENQVRAIGLRMLGHRLGQKIDLLRQDVKRASKLVEASQKDAGKAGLLGKIVGAFFGSDQDDFWKQRLVNEVNAVRIELDPKTAIEAFRSQLSSADEDEVTYLTVPDLVRIAGRDEAKELLVNALSQKKLVLSFDSLNSSGRGDNETLKLARELSLEHEDELSHPHWVFCQSLDAVELFEAFAEMSVTDEMRMHDGGQKDTALMWYIMGLIVHDRGQDVLTFLAPLKDEEKARIKGLSSYELKATILPALEQAGHVRKIQAFLVEALKTHPDLPLWEVFEELSARQGKSKQVLATVTAALANENLLPQTRRELRLIRANSLLAADQLDEGIAEALKLLTDDDHDQDASQDWARSQLALRVAEIGRLLERPEWVNRGTDIASKLILQEPPAGDLNEFVRFLVEINQLARAEKVIIDAIAKQVVREAEFRPHFSRRYGNDSTIAHLLRVYYTAGRPADAVALLEEAPWWNQTDIGEMLQSGHSAGGRHGEPLKLPVPWIAAKSLAAVGRKDEARRIASAMVLYWPNFDPGWELALELTGDDFVPLAEKVFARDRFEERPLIWLAKCHLDKGNLAKAEELARQAIAIDPSDGEQGRGDRMRVYAVLAESVKNKDPKTAAIFEGAVKAIRLAERADQFYAAGMHSRGIRMYLDSLKLFADAYCIQSRLAVQLAEAGDLDGAAEHYQRAFELMPDSFGRVESHCFGCEGVFHGQLAEKIAERVFMKLAKDQPQNPRVHYLLGYLRESESRNADAIKSLREAVRLDPDYLNAWQKLLSVAAADEEAMTAEERDRATFEVLRLDPLGLHVYSDFSKVQDLSKLWKVLHDNARQLPDLEQLQLFELTATKTAAAAAEGNGDSDLFVEHYQSYRRGHFSSHGTLQAISNLIQSTAH